LYTFDSALINERNVRKLDGEEDIKAREGEKHKPEFSVRQSPVVTSQALNIAASGCRSAIISINFSCWALL